MITIPNLVNSNYLPSNQQHDHNNNYHSNQHQLAATAAVDINLNQNKLISNENNSFEPLTGTNSLYSSSVALNSNKSPTTASSFIAANETLSSDVFQLETALSQFHYQPHSVACYG